MKLLWFSLKAIHAVSELNKFDRDSSANVFYIHVCLLLDFYWFWTENNLIFLYKYGHELHVYCQCVYVILVKTLHWSHDVTRHCKFYEIIAVSFIHLLVYVPLKNISLLEMSCPVIYILIIST